VSFTELIHGIHNDLVQKLQSDGEEPPSLAIGLREKPFGDAPPRVIWVPTTGTAEGPHQQGGDVPRTPDNQNVFVPRTLQARRVSFDVHVWAAAKEGGRFEDDVPAVEHLCQRLIAAGRRQIWAYFTVTGEDWLTGQDMRTARGAVCILRVQITIPWTRDEEPVATVTAMPITTTIVPQEASS
jgi:hypothetical protein